MVDRISINPEPPTQGASAEICYDFLNTQADSIDLEFKWEPPSVTEPSGINVTPEEPCRTITIPDDATALEIQDVSGDSAPLSTFIQEA